MDCYISLTPGTWVNIYTKLPITTTSWASGFPIMNHHIYLSEASMVGPPHWGIAIERAGLPKFNGNIMPKGTLLVATSYNLESWP